MKTQSQDLIIEQIKTKLYINRSQKPSQSFYGYIISRSINTKSNHVYKIYILHYIAPK